MFEKIKEYYWKLVGGLPPGEVARQCYREFQKEYEKMVDDKRFELTPNNNGQVDIIDRFESKEKNAICIYNDLGVLPYSSAPALCDLLNGLYDDKIRLECQLRKRTRQRNQLADLNVKLMEENKMLTEENNKLKHQNELLSDELEQCKAVINKKWSEYLKKKELDE